ncbi:MAG: GNAT family N-acetyltransferase [Myxococcota bacterium]
MTFIRPMRNDELDETVRLWERTKKHAYPWLESEQSYCFDDNLAYFRDHVRPYTEVWLATADDVVTGLMAIRGDHIDQLFVDVPWQGRGVGCALVARARELSPHHLSLFTLQRNERACRFYERRGFRAVAYGVSPPPESEPDVRYEWEPSPG